VGVAAICFKPIWNCNMEYGRCQLSDRNTVVVTFISAISFVIWSLVAMLLV